MVKRGSKWCCQCQSIECKHIRAVKAWLSARNDAPTPVEAIDPQVCLEKVMSRFDRLERKLEELANEVKNGNLAKDLPLTMFLSRFCALKAMDENHPTARSYKTGFNRFFEFMDENHPDMENLSELKPIMIAEYVKWLKERRIKKGDSWETLADRTINGYIKKIRHALEIVDKVGTQELRETLITIKRPKLKKNPYIPRDEELARIPKLLHKLRNSRREDHKYLAFVAATVLQFCGRTNALSELRFDMVEENGDGKPIVSYVGKHRVDQVKGLTNQWYKDFLEEWKEYLKHRYGDTPYFFANENGHIDDRTLRRKFVEFMKMCGVPQLTVHSWRYIYATKLYLKGVPLDSIKDILGVE